MAGLLQARGIGARPGPAAPTLDRLVKFGLAIAVAAFFAVMWGLLLVQHLPTMGRSALGPAYAQLLKPGEKERDEQWGVYFAGHHIGQSQVKITRDTEGEIHVRSDTKITINPAVGLLIGLSGDLDIRFEATISPLSGLRDFVVNSDRMHMRMLGRVSEEGLNVIGYIGTEHIRTVLPYSPDVMLGEAFSPLTSMPELSKSDVGRTWSVEMVNPLAGGMQTVTVRVAAMREVELAGGKTRVYRLDFSTGSNRWASWVQQDGTVIIQGTPFGLTIRRDDLPTAVVQQLDAEQPAPPGQ